MKRIFTLCFFALLLTGLFSGSVNAQSATALKFDPSLAPNDNSRLNYVSINNPFRAYQKEITVEFWMYVPNANLQFGSVMGQADNNSTNNTVWLMHPNYNGTMTFYVNNGGPLVGVTSNIIAGGWHHYAGVANATSTKYYIDGVLQATGPGISSTIPLTSNSVIHIGKDVRFATRHITNNDPTNRYAPMTIDELRIWSRALCQDEIQKNMNCERVAQTGLEGLYHFNQGTANGNNTSVTQLDDASGNNRHGTLNNFTLNGTASNWVTSGSTNTGTCSAYVAPAAPITGAGTMCTGSTTTLSNANSGGTWSSSNSSVATINSATGVVTSVSPGTTTISYKTADCGGVSTKTLTVGDPVPPTITCSGNKVLAACETVIPNYTTSATLSDNCTASNSIVVTQSPAAGTVIAPGATITVTLTAKDASNNTSTCNFTVNRPNVTPVANDDAATVCAGGTVNINVLGNDSHPQSLALTVNDNTVPSVGTLVKNADNTFTYTAPANYSGPVTFTYTTKANDGTQAFAGNGHYYEFVSSPGITWTNARAAASARTFNGLRGYLVTITSAAENAFMFNKVGNTAWIGGSDMGQEGVWKWMDGPEAGQHFSNQNKLTGSNCSANTPPQLANRYHNWAPGEPNDCGGSGTGSGAENYAHFRNDALWNDFTNTSSVSGYAVEYGGLETCLPVLTATATVTITVNLPVVTIAAVGGTTACPGSTVTLNANPGTGNSYQWRLNGNDITGANNSSYAAASTGSYTVVMTSNTCVSLPSNAIAVTISDATKPTITCPANQELNLDASCNATLPDYRSLLTASDNCTASNSLVITQSPAAGTVVNGKGAVVITFTVTDASNNSSTCTMTVDKRDVTAPVVNCPAAVTRNNAANTCGAVVTYAMPTATDNCSGSAFNFFNNGEPNNANVNNEDYLQLYTSGTWNDLPNANANRSIVEFNSIITTQFANYSRIGEYGGHTYYLSTGTASWSSSRSAAQTIGGDLASINTLGESQFLAPYGGSTWVGGYQDHSDPGYVEPGNASQNFGGWKWVDGTKLGAGQITITQIAGLPSGSVFPIGVTTNTFRATDESGNSTTCSFTITVVDNQPPVITNCPADISVIASDANGATVNYTAPSATDNCSATIAMTAGKASGSVFPIGVTTVTYRATDAAGNSVDCSFTVTVTGRAPVISCPGNISVNTASGLCAAPVDFRASETTGIPASVITYSIAPGSLFATGTTMVTATATNSIGTSSCTFYVEVKDNEAPIPVAANLPVITAECSATVTPPRAIDNCAGTIAGTTTDPTTYSTQGTYVIRWTFDDGKGNVSTQDQTVVIDDVTAPVPNVATLPTITAECSATMSAPSATDNCAGNVIGKTKDATSFTTQGTYTIHWTFDDGNGNVSTQDQTVVIDDVTAPVPTVESLPEIKGECSAKVKAPAATDNCSGVIIGRTTDATSYTAQGTYTIHWTFDDGNGNVSTQDQTVIVDDITAPVPAVPILPTITAECSASVKAPSATDNCVGNVIGKTTDATSFTEEGTYTIHWTFDDGNGNVSTQDQTVIIDDVTAPVPNVEQLPTITAQCSVTVSAPTATDKCAGTIVGKTNDATSYTSQGTYTIHWTFDDGNGNTSAQDQTVVIRDNVNPTITAPTAVSVSNDAGKCSAVVSIGTPITADNCAVANVTNDHPSSEYPVGTTTVTWTVTDIAGNTSTATQNITVSDTEKPVANCKPITVTLVNGTANITASDVDNNSSDNCQIKSVTISKQTFNCSNIGANEVILTVTDIHNNVSTCTAIVTVVGEIPTSTITSIPTDNTFTGGNPLNLYLGYGAQSTTLKVTTPASGDPYTYSWSGTAVNMLSNTSSASPVFTPTIGGLYTFTVTATNQYGCSTNSTISLCVKDIRVPGTNGSKVYVCHQQGGSKPNVLSISINAVAAHLSNHNDKLGTCEQVCAVTPMVRGTGNEANSTVSSTAALNTQSNQLKADALTGAPAIRISPVPNNGIFNVQVLNYPAGKAEIRILDMNGKPVDTRNVEIGKVNTFNFNLMNKAAGTYYIVVIGKAKQITDKVIIER
jgi:hypothetical protein